MVSGFPPGGVNDLVARIVSMKLAENVSTPVVVDNRPGAAGTLAASMVAKAERYTLLVYSSGFAINAAIQESLPYNPLKDFAGVAQIGPNTQALIVSTSLGIKSVKELVAFAAAQPGKVIMGSSGAGSGSHLIGEMVRLAAGMNVIGGYRVLSARNQHEYDCNAPRRRMLATTGFSGHMGKGNVVAFDNTPMAWERVTAGDFVEVCYWKIACGKK
jgi:Tripartite tricarboxylate transporter family receptor/Surface-adhesin protein E